MSARRSVLQRRALLVGAAAVMKIDHVAVSFGRPRRPDCEERGPVEYEIDVALVPGDRELSVRSR